MADHLLATDPHETPARVGLVVRGFLQACDCGIGYHDNLHADDTCSHCRARHDVTTRHLVADPGNAS